VEWVRETPVVSTWLNCVYYIPNKILKFFTGVDLTKDGGGGNVDGSTTPK
jgi:hypothetical protein